MILIGIVIYRQFSTVDKIALELDTGVSVDNKTYEGIYNLVGFALSIMLLPLIPRWAPVETTETTALQKAHELGTVDIECVDYADNSYNEPITVQCRQHTIEISVTSPDTLCVKFEQRLPNFVLIWFNDTATSTLHDYEMSADDINCMMLTQEVNYIDELTVDTTYTFCIFENTSTTVSPFDCVAHYLPPNDYDEGSDSSLVWISKDERTPVILTGAGAFVVLVWLGIMLGVWLIRRYPNWLKGAKNLVIVDSEVKKPNGSLHRRSDEFSVEDNNSIVYR